MQIWPCCKPLLLPSKAANCYNKYGNLKIIPPPKEVLEMLDIFPVTASDVDGNKIWIDIEVTDDDGLIVSDFSNGPAATNVFGKARTWRPS